MKKTIGAILFTMMYLLAAPNTMMGQNLINQQILTNIQITDDQDQPFTPNNPPHTNSNVRIYLDWSLDHDWNVENGDYFIYQVPQYFSVHNSVTENLPNSAGINYGFFSLGLDGQLKIVFNENVSGKGVAGQILLETSFNEAVTTVNDTIKTGINDDNGNELIFIMGFKTGDITKVGEMLANSNISWSIYINDSLNLITAPVIRDTIPAGLTYNYNSIDIIPNFGADLELTDLPDGRTLMEVRFWDPIPNRSHTIYYTTAITDPSVDSFTNSAEFSGDNIRTGYASATVNLNAAIIDKKYVSYEHATGKINWQIRYYASLTNAELTDQLWVAAENKGNHYLVESNLKVYSVNPTTGAETEYTGWHLEPIEQASGNIINFRIKFNNTTAPALFHVRYATQATIFPIAGRTVFQNIVTTEGKSAFASYSHSTRIAALVTKEYDGIDYVSNTHTWITTINDSQITMEQLMVIDTFRSKGMEFIENSLVITNGSTVLEKNIHYVLAPYNGNYKNGFVITFLGNYIVTDAILTLTYKTYFDHAALMAANQNSYINRAIINYVDESGNNQTAYNEARAGSRENQRDNGAKSGTLIPRGTVYSVAPYDTQTYTDAANNSIAWRVTLNYNRYTIKNGQFTDVLLNKQTYVAGTLKIWTASMNTDGSYSLASALTEGSDYTWSIAPSAEAGQSILTIDFKNDITDIICVHFITSLDNTVYQETYSNTATLTSDNHDNFSWTASVRVAQKASWVQKTGRQGEEAKGEDPFMIYWTVLVNRDSATIENAVLTDSLDSKQKLVLESNGKLALKIFETKKVADDFVKDESKQLIEGINYIVEYTPAGQSGVEKFVVKFIDPNPITIPYIIEYQSQVLATNNQVITNNVTFTGSQFTAIITETQTIVVKLTSGTGSADERQNGQITIKKVNALNKQQLLNNATFELFTNLRGVSTLIRSAKTGENNIDGELIFANLSFGTYTIKEVIAPNGYRIASNTWEVTINAMCPDTTVIIENILKDSKAGIVILTVNGDLIDISSGFEFDYILKCDVDHAIMIGTAINYGTVWFEGSNTPGAMTISNLTDPGITAVNFKVISEDSTTTTHYTLNLIHPFPSNIVVQYWDEVLTINNNANNNGGFNFNEYQWYKNDILLPGGISAILRAPEKLNPSDSYFAWLTTTLGWSAPTCPMNPRLRETESKGIVAYPNPVQTGQPIKVKTGLKDDYKQNAVLYIYDLRGQLIYSYPVSGDEADIRAPQKMGNYVLQLQTGDKGEKPKTFNISVIP